jgi:hypothetical protein
MSARFWITGAGVVICSTVAGFGLGDYAGGRGQGGPWTDRPAVEGLQLADTSTASDTAPAMPQQTVDQVQEPIICKGCGPTLAERHMSADAYAASGSDAVLQDYEADGRATDAAAASSPPEVVATVTTGDSGGPVYH